MQILLKNTYNYIHILKQIHIDHVESVLVLKKSSENHSDPKNSIENSIVDQSESDCKQIQKSF